jgi:hypothetical protein
MPVLIAAVAMLGAVCLLDLVLTFGVIRRLRVHSELLSQDRTPGPPVIGLGVGESPGGFTAVSTSGALLAGPAGIRVTAFFSALCSICPERVPPFVDYLAEHRIPADSVLVVLHATDSQPAPFAGELAQVGQVCVEADDGELARTFRVNGYPAFCLLDADGQVQATGYDPRDLPAPAAAV